ncbi:hypothetical protein HYU94_00670 [Candidatus Daviesbacteria bacterium]|nr:hypothetical protein [Candidatus Daviesbacteria bacterium]
MVTELEINQLKTVSITLLQKAFANHLALGAEGRNTGKFNDFGEVSLMADWDAEETIINGCRQAGIPIVISSEEHGEVAVGDNPQYRGILDGIDGTNAYKMDSGPYGTMFAIFEGINPRYQDYLVTGIIEYPSGRLLIASRNEGAFVMEGNRIFPARTSGKSNLDPMLTKVFIDGGFEFNTEFFKPRLTNFRNLYIGNIGNKGIPWGASSMYYFKLATGETDLVLECTRKRNLEIAVAFGILAEAGGVIVDRHGKSIAQRKYLSFGQAAGEYLPIISAATQTLANELTLIL